jgi:single-strand DNA-binding protein
MKMEIAGAVKVIMPTMETASGFKKREFVVTTKEQYPQDIKCEVTKDKCETLDNFSVGESVVVHFNLRGNEYSGKYYVNVQAWKILRGE